MNLVDKYINECAYNRNYNWCTYHLYINVDQRFVPTKHQAEILKAREKNCSYIMQRQAGSSTIIAVDAITEAMLNSFREIVVFVPTLQSITYMRENITQILSYSSIPFSPDKGKSTITFENNSVIKIMAPTATHYQSLDHPHVIYIDNFDRINTTALSNIFSRLINFAEKSLIIGNFKKDEYVFEARESINLINK